MPTFPFHSCDFVVLFVFISLFQGPGHSHWSYEGKQSAVTMGFFPATQQSLGLSQPWLIITGLLCALTLPSCLTLTLQCMNGLGSPGLL